MSNHGNCGRRPSEYSIQLLIERNKNRVWSKEMREKVSKLKKGKKMPKSAVIKQSKSKRKKVTYSTYENGCWICTSHKPYTKKGYFRIRRMGKYYLLHVLFYEQKFGKMRDGMFGLHRCDNPLCINPDHIFEGTKKDNYHDSYKKDRAQIGERHYKHKLTEEDVINIFNSHDTYTNLSKQFSVSKQNIYRIKKKKIWKHLFRPLSDL